MSPGLPQRRALRLKGYDYSQPGRYFVNICSADRRCIFGRVRNAEIILSPIGEIVDQCWQQIPSHYDYVTLDEYRITPNHMHAILIITDECIDGACPVRHDRHGVGTRRAPLSAIVGSAKSAATKMVHEAGYMIGQSIWQSRFYDRIIWDDRSHFLVRQYIELNPLFWEYDIHNPGTTGITLDGFETILREKYHLAGQALAMVLESKAMSRVRLVGGDSDDA